MIGHAAAQSSKPHTTACQSGEFLGLRFTGLAALRLLARSIDSFSVDGTRPTELPEGIPGVEPGCPALRRFCSIPGRDPTI